jgi:hypothetical protein
VATQVDEQTNTDAAAPGASNKLIFLEGASRVEGTLEIDVFAYDSLAGTIVRAQTDEERSPNGAR